MDAYKVINDILVNLINEIWRLEEKAIITDEFKDLTNTDMHVMEAVGLGEGNNMTAIAKKLSVTVGTLSTSINGLVRKKYVERYRSEKDRRVVIVRLTDKGIAAYHHHEDYHRQLTHAVLAKLTEDEIPVLMKTLDGVTEFFRGYSAQQKAETN
ncbi:MAG: MarR family transcriptional regulator [Lachnospiraceae bacterium]|nr:MarR family transcriptional regulator [Lachnospiraceae bacterium]